MDELLKAKLALYRLLTKKGTDSLTDAEVDQLFALSQDQDVQAYLSGN